MTTTTRDEGWRIVDIVVAAVIAVAFGVVFIAWNAVYAATEPLFAAVRPVQAVMYGIWLLPVGDATGVDIDGVRWPLADATLRMGRSRGLSNEVVEPPASVSLERG
ncbi:MAG: ECF transporter S component, partial [Candidatus Limnocylindria bacterium]